MSKFNLSKDRCMKLAELEGETTVAAGTLDGLSAAPTGPTVLYFGCLQRPGHYLWHPTQGEVRRMDKAQPWGNYIDAGIFQDSKDKERPGVVHSTQFKGWTMVAWADRSVDSRHGSHSTFIVEAEVTPERLIEMARQQWPQVFSRPGFPDLSNAEPIRSGGGVTPSADRTPESP